MEGSFFDLIRSNKSYSNRLDVRKAHNKNYLNSYDELVKSLVYIGMKDDTQLLKMNK